MKKRNRIFPLLKELNLCSQKFLSVLDTLINNQIFFGLSDTKILQIINESDKVRILKNDYECSIKFLVSQLLLFEKKYQNLENSIVKNLGGLYVIGTERNDSRRIDNQLRGRCGRQGDPGKSRFFLSLDDNLLRRFGGINIQNAMQNQLLDDSPLESNLLTKSLEMAQKRVEEQAYDARKYLFDYDEVLNKQRNVVYYERRQILESKSVRDKILAYGEQVIFEISTELKEKNLDSKKAFSTIRNLFGTKLIVNLLPKFDLNYANFETLELETYLFQEFWLCYESKSVELEIRQPGIIKALERTLILIYIDIAWKEHLQKMSLLRDAVGWRGYGQRNPLFEYKEEAYDLFQIIGQTTRHLVIYDLIRSSML